MGSLRNGMRPGVRKMCNFSQFSARSFGRLLISLCAAGSHAGVALSPRGSIPRKVFIFGGGCEVSISWIEAATSGRGERFTRERKRQDERLDAKKAGRSFDGGRRRRRASGAVPGGGAEGGQKCPCPQRLFHGTIFKRVKRIGMKANGEPPSSSVCYPGSCRTRRRIKFFRFDVPGK